MARVQAHVHKLKRHKYKSTGHAVFFCVLDCSFKVDVGLALGKGTICWRCGKETRINEYSIRLARPTCPECKKEKGEKVEAIATEITTAIAADTVSDLRTRLGKTLTFAGQKDEEI